MKKSFIKKLSLSLVLTLGVGILSNTTLVHADNKTQYIEKYEIYPIPQDIQYTGGNVTIPNEVNVVLKGAIDEATQNHLQDTLQLLDCNIVVSNQLEENKFNIIAGISSEEIGYTPKTENLFNKFDANVIEISDNGIKLIGNDSDALYCAVTTLQLMIEQSSNNQLLKNVVEDYADIQYRGYIEGYLAVKLS